MKIGEVARRAGVSVDAVRLYERKGLLATAERTYSGYRDFPEDAATRVADVKVLQSAGLSLDEIRAVFEASLPGRHACGHVVQALDNSLEKLDREIARLTTARDKAASARAMCSAGECGPDSGCRAHQH